MRAVLLLVLLLVHAALHAAPRGLFLPGLAARAADPPSALLPPRSVAELVGLTQAGWEPCASGNTSRVSVAWPASAALLAGGARALPLGVRHVLTVTALTSAGSRVACGGDHLQAQLAGEHLRLRPPTVDRLNGTYALAVDLPEDPLLAGPATLTLTLLFVHFAGMTEAPLPLWQALAPNSVVFEARLLLTHNGSAAAATARGGRLPAPLPSCRDVDFMRAPFWEGHWVRVPAGGGECPPGLCQGSTARLAQPWVYRLPTCTFELFSLRAARQCTARRWAFLMGDSCNQHSVHNLFHDVLGIANDTAVAQLPRAFDVTAAELGTRVTHIWMGGWEEYENGSGLSMCEDRDGLMVLCSHFLAWPGGDVFPDLFLLSSGLHDGYTEFMGDRYDEGLRQAPHHSATANFVSAVDAGIVFFRQLWRLRGDIAGAAALDPRVRNTTDDGGVPVPGPRFLWRHAVAPAGPGRHTLLSNPQKMEIFNHILAAKLVADRGVVPWRFLDEFDMSFPWQYDLNASDTNHYGVDDHRGLAKVVDVMMLHVLLNGLCGPSGQPTGSEPGEGLTSRA